MILTNRILQKQLDLDITSVLMIYKTVVSVLLEDALSRCLIWNRWQRTEGDLQLTASKKLRL